MVPNQFLKGSLAPPGCSGPEGPWALCLQYLAGISEQLESTLDAFYEGRASCYGVSEAATAP